jgi:acyl carrier protein
MTIRQACREDILQLVYESVDEVNAQLGIDQQVRKASETSLVVGTDGLDSLGYINLITAVEEKCEHRFGKFISLSSSGDGGASYETIGELSDYVMAKLAQ